MPSRPRLHQIEDISRRKFESIIPENWVVRNREKDYGIDVEVELFDNNNEANGIVFWVQHKATETSNQTLAKSFDLKIDAINYYKSLEVPVLVVRYSIKDEKFYGKWAHDIDLYYAKESAKTFRIKFDENNEIDINFVKDIELYLEKIRSIKSGNIYLPIPIHIAFNDGMLISQCRKIIREKYSDIFIYENNYEKAMLFGAIGNDVLNIKFFGLIGCVFHGFNEKKLEELSAEELVRHISLGLATNLASIGQSEMSATLLFDKRLKTSLIGNIDIFISFIPMLIATSKYSKTIDAVCKYMDTIEDNTLENFTLNACMADITIIENSKSQKKYRKLLKKCLKKQIGLDNKIGIGIAYYNLGNFLRSIGDHKKAIFHYLKARKFEKGYLEREYFWRELAGSLFEYDKFLFSSWCYKSAIDKGAANLTKALYADALMYRGDYKDAFDMLSDCTNALTDVSDHEIDEWLLKKRMLGWLIEFTGVEKQSRSVENAFNEIEKINDSIRSSLLKKYVDKAIKKDSLCGIAWFNYGIYFSQKDDYEKAMYCFIFCSVVYRNDIEAWVNASISALQADDVEEVVYLFPLVVRVAYKFNNEDYITHLYEKFAEGKKDDNAIKNISNIIESCLPETRQRPTELRILGEDGNYQVIATNTDNPDQKL